MKSKRKPAAVLTVSVALDDNPDFAVSWSASAAFPRSGKLSGSGFTIPEALESLARNIRANTERAITDEFYPEGVRPQ